MPNCLACHQCTMVLKGRLSKSHTFGSNIVEEKGISLLNCIRSLSDIFGSFDIISIISAKVQEIQRYSISRNSTETRQKNLDIYDCNTSGDEENINLGHRQTLLKHSQSCVATCTHRHHTKVASWRHAMTVHRSHIPCRLREPYIEYGYLLPFMPWKYYVRALYTPSYEFMNVWTHLIPSLCFFYLLIRFSQEIDVIHAWPLFLITFSGTMLGGFSALAHLFHSRSSLHHSCWFVADYFGITLYAFSSLTTNFYSGSNLEYFRSFSSNYLNFSIILCFFGYTCLCLTQTNNEWVSTKLSRQLKVYINGFGYLFGALPLFLRMYENISMGKNELALKYHGLAVIFMLSAPILYGSDFPQRLYPGKFDVFGHSHMWFHILTAISAWFDIQAVYYDVLEGPWMLLQQQDSYPTFYKVSLYYVALILYGIICGCLTHNSVKCDYLNEEPFLQGKIRCTCGLPETIKESLEKRLGKSKSSPKMSMSKMD